jgi:hypothetical protein
MDQGIRHQHNETTKQSWRTIHRPFATSSNQLAKWGNPPCRYINTIKNELSVTFVSLGVIVVTQKNISERASGVDKNLTFEPLLRCSIGDHGCEDLIETYLFWYSHAWFRERMDHRWVIWFWPLDTLGFLPYECLEAAPVSEADRRLASRAAQM